MGAKFIVILLSLVCVLIGFIFLINAFISELRNVEVYEGQSNRSAHFTVEFGLVDILIIMTILVSSIWVAVDSLKIEFSHTELSVLISSSKLMMSCLFTCFGLLSKCFLSVKIKSAASPKFCFKLILEKFSFFTRFENLW